jgi:hypothetical protein
MKKGGAGMCVGSALLVLLGIFSVGMSLPARPGESGRVTVVSREAVDLSAVLHNLTGRWDAEASPSDVAIEARERFFFLRKERAVALADSILGKSDLHGFLHLALLLSEPPGFELSGPGLSGSRKGLVEKYREALKDFYLKADFHSFEREHAADVRARLDGFQRAVDEGKAADVCEAYFGSRWGRYVLVFTPHLTGLRMSRLIESGGGPSPVVLFGQGFAGAGPDDPGGGREFLRRVVFRELGRQFAVRALEGREDLLDRSRRLLSLLPSENPERKPWPVLFLRGLTSAFEIRLVRRAFGEDVSARVFEEFPGEEDRLVRLLDGLLEEYENRRDTYATLADFVPRLLRSLAEKARGK